MAVIRPVHIPYKNWFGQPKPDPQHDLMNWLEVERWTLRLNEQVAKGSGGFSMVWGVPALVYIQGSATFTTPVSGKLVGIMVSFSQAPTGGTHSLQILKDGAVVWSGNVPAATNPWTPASLPDLSTIADTSLWKVRVVSVGTGSPTDQAVALRFG